MGLAVAFQRIAHEGLVETAIHTPAADHLVELGHLDADLARQCERLRIKRGIAKRQEVVQKFHPMAIADPADMHDLGSPCRNNWLDPGEYVNLGPNHTIERSRPCLFRGAAKGSIGEMHADRGELYRDALGHRRITGGTINDHAARLKAGLQRCNSHSHFGRSGQAQEDDRTTAGHLLQRCHLYRAPRYKIFDRCAVAMRDHSQRIALFNDILRHTLAHQSDADEANLLVCLCHYLSRSLQC